MLDLMTWSEVVDNLQSEGNLTMAAIFDLDGEKLAATQGVAISKTEVLGVMKSLQIPCTTIYALHLGGMKVSCMRVDQHTLIGRGPDEVFVAYRSNNVLICAFAALDSNNSCLASVKNFALKLNMQPVPDAVAAPSLI